MGLKEKDNLRTVSLKCHDHKMEKEEINIWKKCYLFGVNHGMEWIMAFEIKYVIMLWIFQSCTRYWQIYNYDNALDFQSVADWKKIFLCIFSWSCCEWWYYKRWEFWTATVLQGDLNFGAFSTSLTTSAIVSNSKCWREITILHHTLRSRVVKYTKIFFQYTTIIV